MAAQNKVTTFGCSSTHRIKKRSHTSLSAEQFLALDETKKYIADNPDSYSQTNDGIFISPELTLRYLHLTGDKKAKKALRKSLEGNA
ncbi:hypothetical protein [Pantoea sp. ACRSB]|uniref:hypothetical protein n=1 Tax=Pantoea sp. ACRSB TaxID=2918207 RepID=UPI0028931771|nr:hypothetical protein [Pantoea sp. ACRSB]MCG7388715.1 hypothetical protein [Pantoea sp. ACRSB]